MWSLMTCHPPNLRFGACIATLLSIILSIDRPGLGQDRLHNELLAGLNQRSERLRALDVTIVYHTQLHISPKRLLDEFRKVHVLSKEERFAFKDSRRRYEHNVQIATIGSGSQDVLSPGPRNIDARMNPDSSIGNRNIQAPSVSNRNSIDRIETSSQIVIYDGRRFLVLPRGEDAIAQVFGAYQSQLVANSFSQSRYISLLAIFVDDPTEDGLARKRRQLSTLPSSLGNEFQVVTDRKYDRTCLRVERPNSESYRKTYWLDPEMGFAILASELSNTVTGTVTSRVVHLGLREVADKLWLPNTIRHEEFSEGGVPLVTTTMEVKKLAVNKDVLDSIFEIELARGQKVFDFELASSNGQPTQYFVGTSGGGDLWGGRRSRRRYSVFVFAGITCATVILVAGAWVLVASKRRRT